MIATPTDEGTTMAAQSAKSTVAKKDTTTVKTSTTSDAATGRPDAATATGTPTAEPKTVRRPEPSARSGIRLNVGVVQGAVDQGNSSRAVKAIQYALADRGFEPGRRDGVFDQGTLHAYSRYQSSIGARADGLPTTETLDYLGFDLI